jgi:para-aminobenzoate synthetase component 1
MTAHPPLVPAPARPPAVPPGCPPACGPRLRERDRLQWRLGDPGDPAALVTEFLAEHGLPVRDLAVPARDTHDDSGAALHVSAAAGARMTGGAEGAASPAPAVPDLVAVVYAHADPADDPTRNLGVHTDLSLEKARRLTIGPWVPSWSTEAHADAVRAVRDAIAAGDVYQVNVVGHASAAYRGDPAGALRRVAALPGARYGGVLSGPGWALACASPETLVQVHGGRVVTRPIKGTRPATAAGRAELLASTKERAEHVMIVDLERNDLARVARTGSVRVAELYAVRRWCDLWQAESTVHAQLADGVDLAGLLRAVCPGGSVTGAPKLAALEVIARVEPVGRGPSMGALGWVSGQGIDLGLTIRTAVADGDRLHVWAGGGITWGSDPGAEVAEAAAKSAPLRAALAGPDGPPATGR